MSYFPPSCAILIHLCNNGNTGNNSNGTPPPQSTLHFGRSKILQVWWCDYQPFILVTFSLCRPPPSAIVASHSRRRRRDQMMRRRQYDCVGSSSNNNSTPPLSAACRALFRDSMVETAEEDLMLRMAANKLPLNVWSRGTMRRSSAPCRVPPSPPIVYTHPLASNPSRM